MAHGHDVHGLVPCGLYPVTVFGGQPYFPGPWESADTIAAFFQARPTAVRVCAFLQFGAAIPLGIFTASVVSRLQFLGARVAGVSIALFGGIATAVMMMAASSALWVMAQPGIAENRAVLQALYWLVQGLGGAGFSVPFGILVAGVTIPAAFMRLVPNGSGAWDRGRDLRRAELALSDGPRRAAARPAGPVPGFCLDDRHWLRAPQFDRAILGNRRDRAGTRM